MVGSGGLGTGVRLLHISTVQTGPSLLRRCVPDRLGGRRRRRKVMHGRARADAVFSPVFGVGTSGGRAIGRRWRLRTVWIVLVGCLALLGPAVGRASATTVVSLTFDDGRQTQYAVKAPLAAHGMHGTF